MKKETAPTLNDSDRALDGAAKAPSVGNMFANCIYKFDKLDHRAQLANQTVGVLLKGLKLSDIAKTYTKNTAASVLFVLIALKPCCRVWHYFCFAFRRSSASLFFSSSFFFSFLTHKERERVERWCAYVAQMCK